MKTSSVDHPAAPGCGRTSKSDHSLHRARAAGPRAAVMSLVLALAWGGVSCKRDAGEAQAPASEPDAAQQPQPTEPASTAAEPAPAAASQSQAAGFATTNRYVYKGYYALQTNAPKALLQDVILRRAAFKQTGDDFFGFTVRKITPEFALLERDGVQYRLPLVTNGLPALAVPGITPSNYPPGFVQYTDNTNPAVPAPPPPESASVRPLNPDQIPANVRTQLQQRLQQKATPRP